MIRTTHFQDMDYYALFIKQVFMSNPEQLHNHHVYMYLLHIHDLEY